jgi:Uma2 family endonuclease
MGGASADHNIIAGNIFAKLHRQLRGKRCTPIISDMKVKIPPADPNYELTFYYPDVVVACGEKEPNPYYREEPEVIFEVLSPSTADRDSREKRVAYLRIPSIEGFITVAQDKMDVIVYRRRGRNFEMMRWRRPEDTVILGTIDCELTLAHIYEGVSWNPPQPGT